MYTVNVCIVIDMYCMKVQLIYSSRTSNFTSGSESIEITEAVYLKRFILTVPTMYIVEKKIFIRPVLMS